MAHQQAGSPQAWLENEDTENRAERVERLTWLIERTPSAESFIFPGGLTTKYLFEEARYSFVYGQFIATAVLGLAFIEQTLAALFYAAGRNDLERARLPQLLREGVQAGWLTSQEAAKVDNARAIRNSLAHFRRPLDKDRIEHRAFIDERVHPYGILGRDASDLMEVVLSLFGTSLLAAR